MSIKIPDFAQTRVLVAGDVMLDQYWQGPTQRISPEAPVPVVRIVDQTVRAGGAANVALNIAAVGGKAILIGVVGDDAAARQLEGLLQDCGVACRLQRLAPRTITKLRVLSHHQQLIRLDFEERIGDLDLAFLLEEYARQLDEVDCVVLSDYAKGTLAPVREMIRLARARGLPVLIDPKGTDYTRYAHASLLTPNLSEFEAVVGTCGDDAELVSRGESLRARLDLDALLITRGEQGMTLLERGRPLRHIAAKAKEVYDVTGAGDTVVAILGAALAAGSRLADAVELANLAAGVVVGKLGTATVSVEEIAAAMDNHLPLPRGVATEDDLLAFLSRARRAGERIVMTNGCFDLLHPGHVAYLEQARALGDRLVVAVNDDDSIRRLKGEGRPVNDLAARMSVLAGLQAVDWVVPFTEDTPERLICRVLPDVLVKGGDYRPEEIAGGDCVRAAGGEVRVLPYVQGYSTSRMIDRIRKD